MQGREEEIAKRVQMKAVVSRISMVTKNSFASQN